MKKKTSLLLFLLFFLMLPVSAAASDTSKETVPTPDEQLEARPENCSMGFNIPDRHGDKVVDTLQNNPQFDWPWKYINDEVHRLYGYYTSMGCDDVICRDPAHTHWCPSGLEFLTSTLFRTHIILSYFPCNTKSSAADAIR